MGLIKIYVPAVEAKPGPPLAPILGQHQINLMEFCKEFNKASVNWFPSLPLPVKVNKLEGNKFTFKIHAPTFRFLINQILDSESTISVERLYDVLTLKSPYLTLNLKRDARLLFGFLASAKRIKIQL